MFSIHQPVQVQVQPVLVQPVQVKNMAYTTQQLINMGYGGYAGWGDAEANANFLATGGSGKETSGGGSGGGSGTDSVLQNAINSVTGMLPSNLKPYEEANPFFFDEKLAKEASTAEYSPYYSELLSDYVSTVERTKSRSTEDLKTVLSQLASGREYYLGKERRMLDKALDNTNKGYAGKGLFFSGAREKDRKEYQTEYEKDIGNYESQYQYKVGQAKLGKTRTLEDLLTQENRYKRDVGREEEAAIASGVLQRKREAQQEYEIGRNKYYEGSLYPSIV